LCGARLEEDGEGIADDVDPPCSTTRWPGSTRCRCGGLAEEGSSGVVVAANLGTTASR
jgi:hypothetical protein